MKQRKLSKVIAFVLCFAMLIGVAPMSVFATIANWDTENVVYDGNTFGTNGYYNVVSKKDYTLVPGAATETEMVINNAGGTRRQVMHIIEVDPSNPAVSILPGYYGIDKFAADPTDVSNYKVAGVTDTAKYYDTELGYKVVGAMNTCLAYDSNAPFSYLVYNGEVLVDKNNNLNNYHSGSCQTILCVYKDDVTGECSCELRTTKQGLRGDEWQAIGANFGMTVSNGQLVANTEERTSSAAARSMVGVKEDGTLVLVMTDGRGANNSVGFCDYELGESMLSLGCKWAFNCDGGGSSSFVTRRAGEDDLVCRCVPCDGAERPTIGSVLIASNVAATGILDTIEIESEYDIFAPGTSYTFATKSIDTHGYALETPSDITWSLSDSSFGTIENGSFTSNGKTGDVDVLIHFAGDLVGQKKITVANPTTLTLSAASTVLPYSTAEKPRKVVLPIVAAIGEQKVFVDATVFNITSSVPSAGTIDGFTFTATTDESVASTVINIKYLPTNQSLTYSITFGKGSDILWDFEDGDISNWYGGSKDVKEWLTENGVAEADQLKTLISGGQISYSEQSHTFLSTRENGGQVHNGNNALGVDFDFRNVEFNSWVYAILYNVQDQYVLRDVANGKNATALGMWCYVPEGFCNPAGDTSGALAMQLTVYKNPQGTSGAQLNFQFYSERQKKRVSLNQCTEADIPENRWVYLTADLTGSNYYSLPNPKGTSYREPSFFRMYIKPTRAQILTYYFDDFTLDYSSAVDDRNAPVITNTTYCIADTNIELDNQTINTNTVSFDANIADYAASNSEGLDYSSAAIYADGVKLDGVSASGNVMGVKNVELSNGTHNIKFEIYDNAGNFSSVTKKITVDADATKSNVTVAGHNDKNNVPESDSIYYVDLIASDITQISSVTATIKLNTANKWELDHMIPAKGYNATYVYNEISKLATVTVEKVDKNDLTGEQILVSIPAKVWSFDETTDVGGDGTASTFMTAQQRFNSSYGEPKVFIDVDVVSGLITYNNNTTGTFGGNISVATKLAGNKSNGMWHQHTPVNIEDKAPTCTEKGYTGRTYCETCGSVVDFGTDVPATGHAYEQIGETFVCSECGEQYDYSGITGLFEVNGVYYYAIAGNLTKGWQQIDDDWYYFDKTTYRAVETLNYWNLFDYHFDNTGKLLHGEWYTNEKGTRYYVADGYVHTSLFDLWLEIDGKLYCFDKSGYKMVGIHSIYDSREGGYKWGIFDDDGVFVEYYTGSGLFTENGYLYNVVDGYTASGLMLVDGDYYYAHSANKCACAVNTESYCYDNHGMLPAGYYTFGADGKMLNNAVYNDNGTLKYYVGGVVSAGDGIVNINGVDTEITSEGVVLFTGTFTDASAKTLYYVNGIETYVPKNGLVIEDGVIVYYVDDEPIHAGVVTDGNGNYYYINSTLKGVKNCSYYIEKTNGLIVEGQYDIAEDGTIIDPVFDVPEPQNGLVIEDGVITYYVDDVPVYAGVVTDGNGNFYYINSTLKGVKDCSYYIGKTNGLIVEGQYDIAEDGKIINPIIPSPEPKNGLVIENGIIAYYVDDAPVYAGVVTDGNGNFYYINSTLKGVKDCSYYIGKTNGLIEEGQYDIAEDGKIINPVLPSVEPKNGLVIHDGTIVYYVDDTPVYAGVVTDGNGNFYYINSTLKGIKNCSYYIGKTNGLIVEGQYQIAADGKIINPALKV